MTVFDVDHSSTQIRPQLWPVAVGGWPDSSCGYPQNINNRYLERRGRQCHTFTTANINRDCKGPPAGSDNRMSQIHYSEHQPAFLGTACWFSQSNVTCMPLWYPWCDLHVYFDFAWYKLMYTINVVAFVVVVFSTVGEVSCGVVHSGEPQCVLTCEWQVAWCIAVNLNVF